jgi:hypothetical protein
MYKFKTESNNVLQMLLLLEGRKASAARMPLNLVARVDYAKTFQETMRAARTVHHNRSQRHTNTLVHRPSSMQCGIIQKHL